MDARGSFTLADYFMFSITVVISISVGVYYAVTGGKQRTTSEFMVAGRSMSFLPVAVSLFISFESSIMMLGMPAEGYVYGLQAAFGFFPLLLVNMLCTWIAAPLLYPLKITSAYEYLELRFNSKFVRRVGSVMDVIYNMWYMGIVLFGPAVALESVTNFPFWVSIFGLALVAVIYTSIGGLKAVIWTDVFQAVVMLTGVLAVLIKGTMGAGGAKAVWDIAAEGGRSEFLSFSLDPRVRHTVWNLLTNNIIQGFALGYKQSSVQRLSSTTSLEGAKRMYLFVGPASFLIAMLSLYEGIVSFAYYDKKGCDPFEFGRLTNPNQIIPYIVMDMFHEYTGMPGLFLASLFSASLSTLSSCLSSLSAVIWTDFIHPAIGDTAEWKATLIAKLIVIMCGIGACGLAYLTSLVGGPLNQIAGILMSSLLGPLTGLFLLGTFFPRATAKGASIGGILSVILTIWISSGMSFRPGIRNDPYLHPASTDKCDIIYNDTSLWATNGNASWVSTANGTTGSAWAASNSDFYSDKRITPHGIEHLYTISYTWIGPMGVLATIGFGYLFSLITGPNKPGDVDPRYLLPVSDSVLIWMPKRLRRYISSKGTQFIHRPDDKTQVNPEIIEVKPLVAPKPTTMSGLHQPSDVTNRSRKTDSGIIDISYRRVELA